jgi:tetratricopeptide (TPR) repeat protein
MNARELLQRAEACRRTGDEAGALAAYTQAAAAAQAVFEPAVEARAMLGVGEMRLLQDDPAGARQAFDDAIGRAVEGGDPEVEAEAWFGLASACFDAGASKDGHDALLEAMALARDLADRSPTDRMKKGRLARAVRLYGEHIGVLGSESDAKQALELARIMYTDLGDLEAARSVQQEIEKLNAWAR